MHPIVWILLGALASKEPELAADVALKVTPPGRALTAVRAISRVAVTGRRASAGRTLLRASPPVLTPRTRQSRHEDVVAELTAEMLQEMLLAPPRPRATPPASPPAPPLPSVKEDPSDFSEMIKRLPPPPV